MLVQIRERGEYQKSKQEWFLFPLCHWSWRIWQGVEGRTEENALDVRHERNVEGQSGRQEKCALSDQWKEILKSTLSSILGKHELCIWWQRESILSNRSYDWWWSQVSSGQAQKILRETNKVFHLLHVTCFGIFASKKYPAQRHQARKLGVRLIWLPKDHWLRNCKSLESW